MSARHLIIACYLVVAISMVALFEFTLNQSFIGSDDAYIHLRYIDNLRAGRGFGFNPGKPSNGSTSPLWVLIAAAITRHAPDLLQAVKILSTILFVASAFIFFVLSRRLACSSTLAALATSIYVSDPWLLKWAGSAMETSLTSLILLLSVYFMLTSDKCFHLLFASFLLGLATLARPEAALLFCLFLLLQITTRESLSGKLGRTVVALTVYLFALLPWLVFACKTFGSPVPNTFAAKTVASQASIWAVGWYFLRIIGITYWPWLLTGAGCIFAAFRTPGISPRLGVQNRVIVLLWVWCAIVPAFYAFSKLQTPSTRYLQVIIPLLIATGFYCLVRLASSISPSKVYSHLVLALVGIAVILYNIALNAGIVLPSSHDFSEGVLKTYQSVGEWLASNTPEDSRIAVAIDVGTIAYYSNREIIDLGGLNTPEVIPYLPDGLNYVFVSKPEWLVVTGENNKYALLSQSRFRKIAVPVISFHADLGLRAEADRMTGGSTRYDYYVSVYRLQWP